MFKNACSWHANACYFTAWWEGLGQSWLWCSQGTLKSFLEDVGWLHYDPFSFTDNRLVGSPSMIAGEEENWSQDLESVWLRSLDLITASLHQSESVWSSLQDPIEWKSNKTSQKKDELGHLWSSESWTEIQIQDFVESLGAANSLMVMVNQYVEMQLKLCAEGTYVHLMQESRHAHALVYMEASVRTTKHPSSCTWLGLGLH